MEVNYGSNHGTHEFGPGVEINLTGEEVAVAIGAYLTSHSVHVSGPRTISVNGKLCDKGLIYVDPSGFAIVDGHRYDGKGPTDETNNVNDIPEFSDFVDVLFEGNWFVVKEVVMPVECKDRWFWSEQIGGVSIRQLTSWKPKSK